MVTTAALVGLSRRMLDTPRSDYVASAAEEIRRLLPGDDVCWIQCDWDDGAFVVWRSSMHGRDTAAEGILPNMYANPAIQSYVRTPSDLSPRRLSDLPQNDDAEVDAFRSSQEYIGHRQLSMIVNVASATVGHGWVVTRDGRDFGSDELDTATRLLPVLYLLHQFCYPNLARTPVLTSREEQVVDLLTAGFTAVAIGHILGISPRTVRKHLENVYRKLGTHDRLLVALHRPLRARPSSGNDTTG